MEIESKKENIIVALKKIEESLNEMKSYNKSKLSEILDNGNLENEIDDVNNKLADFQRYTINNKNYDKIKDDFENRLENIEKKFDYFKSKCEGIVEDMDDIEKQSKVEDLGSQLMMKKNQGDVLIGEMKNRTKGIKENIEKMEDTLDAIEEDILEQREKLFRIKGKVKESQNVVKKLEESVKQLTKTLYQDKFVKIMIILITIILLVLIIQIFRIKFKQINTDSKDDFEFFLKGEKKNYWKNIDENIFTENNIKNATQI